MKAKLAHAPIESTKSKDIHDFSKAIHNADIVEPKLVVAVTSMGKHAKFHPMILTVQESLPTCYTQSNTRLLLYNTALAVKLDQEIIKQETCKNMQLWHTLLVVSSLRAN
uniref:Uncharacterized protein n=1 Tax=Physcomitrium patens TaxID=3218 RepID=A0A2K1KUC4_PHYPA|nr:hypothetical protein PHYPA_004381 [Physcomitrium patens]